MIVPVNVAIEGEKTPQQHYALVFDDVVDLKDFTTYRNALVTIVKEMQLNADNDGSFGHEFFWLLQMAEYIDKSLDEALTNKTI